MEGRQATGAYAPAISAPPDDLASQLERLLDERPTDVALAAAAEAVAVEPTSPEAVAPVPAAEVGEPPPEPVALAPLLDALRTTMEAQLDELRDQLDDAFNEMADRISGTELRWAALRTTAETQTELTQAVGETGADTLALLRQLVATVDRAVEAPANLAQDVENLASAIREQDKLLGEVQVTLEWIKQRLLNR